MEEIKSEVTTREIKIGDTYKVFSRGHNNCPLVSNFRTFTVQEILSNGHVVSTSNPEAPGINKYFVHSREEILLESDILGNNKDFPKYIQSNKNILTFNSSSVINRDNTFIRSGHYSSSSSRFLNRTYDFDHADLILLKVEESELNVKQHNYEELIEELSELKSQQHHLFSRVEAIREELQETQKNCIHDYVEKEATVDGYEEGYSVTVITIYECAKCFKQKNSSCTVTNGDD